MHIARKLKKLKERQDLRVKGPNPTHRWIRISRTPLGRWIDPDPLNLDRTTTNTGEWVSFEPTRFRAYIKGERIRFAHFLERFSLLFFSPSPFSETLTLVQFESTQNHTNHGLIASSYRSKHVLGVEIHVYEPSHRGSEVSFMDFKRFRGSFFDSNLLF